MTVGSEYSKATAYHEAGHVTCAVVLHIALEDATIVPAGGYLGLVRMVPRPMAFWQEGSEYGELSHEQRSEYLDWMTCLLAGQEAERRVVEVLDSKDAESDDEKVADAAATICDGCKDEADALVDWLVLRANRILTAHWDETERIADALLAHGTISADRILDVWRGGH